MADVQRSCIAANDQAEKIGLAAFGLLFARRPELTQLFSPKVLKSRGLKVHASQFTKTVCKVVEERDNLANLLPTLQRLGRSHRGIPPDAYESMAECFLDALKKNLGHGCAFFFFKNPSYPSDAVKLHI